MGLVPKDKFYKLMAATAIQWTDLDNPPEVLTECGKRWVDADKNPCFILEDGYSIIELASDIDEEEVKIIRLTDWVVYYGDGLWSFVTDKTFRHQFWPEEIIREAMGEYMQRVRH